MTDDIELKRGNGRVTFSVSKALFDEMNQNEKLGLVTYEEAAELLQLSKAMVHKLVGSGQLKPVKIGRRAFLKRDHVAVLAQRGTKKTKKR